MSTKKYANVENILVELMTFWKLDDYASLAKHINVPYQTLMAWKKRNSIGDYAPFMDKGISKNWLETGEGNMRRAIGIADPPKGITDIGIPYPHGTENIKQSSVRISQETAVYNEGVAKRPLEVLVQQKLERMSDKELEDLYFKLLVDERAKAGISSPEQS